MVWYGMVWYGMVCTMVWYVLWYDGGTERMRRTHKMRDAIKGSYPTQHQNQCASDLVRRRSRRRFKTEQNKTDRREKRRDTLKVTAGHERNSRTY